MHAPGPAPQSGSCIEPQTSLQPHRTPHRPLPHHSGHPVVQWVSTESQHLIYPSSPGTRAAMHAKSCEDSVVSLVDCEVVVVYMRGIA